MNSLSDLILKCKTALKEGATAPLLLAEEIVKVAEEWDARWKQDMDMSCNAWLRVNLGPGKSLSYWRVRADAVAKLGESIRRTLDHDVAAYVVRSVPEPNWSEIVEKLQKKRLAQSGNVATIGQAERIVFEVLGRRGKPRRKCPQCALLQAEIDSLRAQAPAPMSMAAE